MPLAISLAPKSAFYVGETKVSVVQIDHHQRFKVCVHTPALDKEFWITDRKSTEILPNVRVSAGHKVEGAKVKAVIEAPRHIKILRGKHVDGGNPETAPTS